MRFIVFGVTYLFFATHLLMYINYFWDKSKYPRIIWMRKSVTYSCFFYLVLCQRTEEKAALLSGTINPFSQWPKIASRVDLTRVPSPVLLHISNVSVCLDSYKRARRSLELIFKLYYFFFLFILCEFLWVTCRPIKPISESSFLCLVENLTTSGVQTTRIEREK